MLNVNPEAIEPAFVKKIRSNARLPLNDSLLDKNPIQKYIPEPSAPGILLSNIRHC
jgi:hypothetical protein